MAKRKTGATVGVSRSVKAATTLQEARGQIGEFKEWLDGKDENDLRALLVDAWWKGCFTEIPVDGNCADARAEFDRSRSLK